MTIHVPTFYVVLAAIWLAANTVELALRIWYLVLERMVRRDLGKRRGGGSGDPAVDEYMDGMIRRVREAQQRRELGRKP